MIKLCLLSIALCVAAAATFAQAPAPAGSASAPVKHKLPKKLRIHKPAQPAQDPERSPDKKGGA